MQSFFNSVSCFPLSLQLEIENWSRSRSLKPDESNSLNDVKRFIYKKREVFLKQALYGNFPNIPYTHEFNSSRDAVLTIVVPHRKDDMFNIRFIKLF